MPEEIKPTEIPKEEPPKPEVVLVKHKYTYEGQIIELSDEERERAVYLGLVKAAEIQSAKDKKVEEPKKEEPKKEEEPAWEKKIAALEKKLEDKEASQRQMNEFQNTVAVVNTKFKDVDPDFAEDLKLKVLMNFNEAKQKGFNISVQEICDKAIELHNKRMEKFAPKIKIDEKEKDRKLTEKSGTGKGTSAGQDTPKKLGRSSFRDGSLAKQVNERMKSFLTE